MCVGMVATAKPAHANLNGTKIYNNSSTSLGIVTNLGDGYSYLVGPYRWSNWGAKGGYTGWGWCTNVYYDLGDGRWQYRFQIRGGKFWSVAYAYTDAVRADSWRC